MSGYHDGAPHSRRSLRLKNTVTPTVEYLCIISNVALYSHTDFSALSRERERVALTSYSLSMTVSVTVFSALQLNEFQTYVSDLEQHTEWKVVDTANSRHNARPYTTAAIACGAFIDRVSSSRAPREAGATHNACVHTFAKFSTCGQGKYLLNSSTSLDHVW